MSSSQQAAGVAPRPVALILTVVAPFGLGYFLSYLFRTVNAIISPQLTSEMDLTASDLGLLTSLYFIVFAAFQLPLGVLLDRYGPRRVQAALLLVGAVGAALFAIGETFEMLALGRGLIGLGASGCLMAAIQGNVLWWPAERLALVNGMTAAFGSFGALVSTVPVELMVGIIGWRGVFGVLAGATVLVAILTWAAVPERRAPQTTERPARLTTDAATGWRAQLADLAAVYGSAFFWRVSVVVLMHNSVFLSYQSLWAGSWLRDVAGLDRIGVANGLLSLNVGMFTGVILLGVAADRLQKLGIKPIICVGTGIAITMVTQLMFGFGVAAIPMALCFLFGFFGSSTLLIYAVFGQHFPRRLIGRVNTAQNMLIFFAAFAAQWGIGAVIDLWPPLAEGRYPPEAQQTALLMMTALESLAFLWFVWPRRRA